MLKERSFVVVTTAHRGVFGGYMNGGEKDAKTVELSDAHMCVYWSTDVQGILGLAASGPSKTCKVTPAVPTITLQDVTSIIDCTPDAEKAWKERPWR